nr:MAG TPA: hypothetical protein [Caudoviricetes sp.]
MVSKRLSLHRQFFSLSPAWGCGGGDHPLLPNALPSGFGASFVEGSGFDSRQSRQDKVREQLGSRAPCLK